AAIGAYAEHIKNKPDEKDIVAMDRTGDGLWNMAESYDVIGDHENALSSYKQAVEYYEKAGAQSKMLIGNALIAEIQAKIAIKHGNFQTASEMLSTSIMNLNESIRRGGLTPAQLKLVERHNTESQLLSEKVKGTPVVVLTVDAPKEVEVGKAFPLRISLMNPSDLALRNIKLMPKLAEEFAIEKAASQVISAEPKSSQEINIDIIARKSGDYKFKPLEMFYTDDRGNGYMRGSNQVSIKVVEKKQPEAQATNTGTGDSGYPDVSVTIYKPAAVAKDSHIMLKGILENTSPTTVTNIRFLASVPPEFEVVESIEVIKELEGHSTRDITLELIAHNEGAHRFKPIEIFYRDPHGNRYFKSSNEIEVQVGAGRKRDERTLTIYDHLKFELEGMQQSVVLVSLESQQHAEAVAAIIKLMVSEAIMGGVYVSVSRPYEQMIATLESAGVKTGGNLLFIDCISHLAGKVPEKTNNAVFVENPSSLEEVSMYTDKLLEKVPQPKFIMVDSLSSLLIYNSQVDVEELAHRLINKARHEKVGCIIISVKQKESEALIKTLTPMCDREVVL
ncbi:MAG: hypothetical protein PHG85_02510, partial [Candidatus Altiarchaeota archaeon]|nr:hypothetical protein [Candidatus Altiarchaeota archaeon]